MKIKEFVPALMILAGCMIYLTLHSCSAASAQEGNQLGEIRKEMTNEFQQVKHLIGANTSQQIIYLKVMYLKPDINVDLAKKTAASVWRHSRAMKKNPDLVLAIIDIESTFRQDVPSPVGALGLMQVMPVHQQTVCHGYNLREIDDNIKCGTQVYSMYEAQYKDMKLALTVYNRGPSAVDQLMSKGQNPMNGYADKVLAVYNKLQAIGEMGSEEL
jgi:soluble lytic murein transglycosylase-like protein